MRALRLQQVEAEASGGSQMRTNEDALHRAHRGKNAKAILRGWRPCVGSGLFRRKSSDGLLRRAIAMKEVMQAWRYST